MNALESVFVCVPLRYRGQCGPVSQLKPECKEISWLSWQEWEVICAGWWCEQCSLSSICRKEETFVWEPACIHVWAAVASQLLNSDWCGGLHGEWPLTNPLCLTPAPPPHPQRLGPRTWHTALIALSVFCVKISPKPAPLSWTVNLHQISLSS